MNKKDSNNKYTLTKLIPLSIRKLLNEDIIFRYEILMQSPDVEKEMNLLKPMYDTGNIPKKLTKDEVNAIFSVLLMTYEGYVDGTACFPINVLKKRAIIYNKTIESLCEQGFHCI